MRVTIFTREHLLPASQIVWIEPQRDGERAAAEIGAVFEFDHRIAIKHKALASGSCGGSRFAANDE